MKELYLHHNNLVAIAADTFAALKSLTLLRLDGNRLADFPVWELASNPLLASVHLAANLWNCDCGFLNAFLVYQWKTGSKIQV